MGSYAVDRFMSRYRLEHLQSYSVLRTLHALYGEDVSFPLSKYLFYTRDEFSKEAYWLELRRISTGEETKQ